MDRPLPTPDLPAPVAPSADWLADERPRPLPLPAAPPPAPPAGVLTGWDTLRRFVQVLAAFVCLFLLVRSLALEPFGVPTGSMASALIGNHREMPCNRCGYPVRVGVRAHADRPADYTRVRCPNCGELLDLTDAPEVPGDRLLVDKHVYQARSPRRWEVAVFRCPVDMTKPYVKRTVGLPGEFISLRDGDAFANDLLLRKPLGAIRQMAIPFFDLNYPPVPDGWGPRWLIEPVAGQNAGEPRPADATIFRDGGLFLDASATPETAVGLTYRNWNFTAKKEEPLRDPLAYNGSIPERWEHNPTDGTVPPIHDFAVRFDLEVLGGSGCLALRLADGGDYATAEIPLAGGPPPAAVIGAKEETPPAPPVKKRPFAAKNPMPAPQPPRLELPAEEIVLGIDLLPGKVHRIEFAFVDRRIVLAIDGKEVGKPLDLPPREKRNAVSRPFQIGVRGASVAVKNLVLLRDIHYLAEGPNGRPPGCQLGADEYFMLGDNTADSQDSRQWVIPGVPERDFVGKPFLIHQPMRAATVTVNGQERKYQSVDWSRLRWLR